MLVCSAKEKHDLINMMAAPKSVFSPRHAALAARNWDGDDPGILRWEQAFVERINDLRDDAGIQFLNSYVLAPGDWTAVAVMRTSWSAFELLDRWFPTNFTEICDQAEQVREPLSIGLGTNMFRGAVSDYPVLALLSQEHSKTDTGGVQVAKALLLGAMFQNSMLATAGAVGECADGLRKSLTMAEWAALVDWDSLAYGNDLPRTIDDAQQLLDAAVGKLPRNASKVHESFLAALGQILEALRTGGAQFPKKYNFADGAEPADDAARAAPPTEVRYPEPPLEEVERQQSGESGGPSSAGEAKEGEVTAPADQRSAELGGETDEHAEFRALRTGFLAAITNQYLPVDQDQLLDHELKALVRALRAALVADRAQIRRAAALLTTSLFTGETLSSILQSRVEPTVRPGFKATGQWMRVVRPEPSARVASKSDRKLLARHGDRFELAMPVDVTLYFEAALAHAAAGMNLADALRDPPETILRQAQDWIRDFREKHPRVLVGKVSRWLRTALYSRSHDHVAVHLLTAVESDPVCPAAYYRAPRAIDLQALHRKLVASVWVGDISRPHTPSVRVGSWWYPADGELKRLYTRAFETMRARADDQSLPLWRRHSAHQVMSVLNITVGTAMRRVADPGESLEMFDLERALGVLDDKSGGPTRGHRLVPLAAVVTEQFREQTSYLRRLTVTLALERPDTAATIAAMLAHPEKRIAPLFFLFDENYRIRSLEPRDIEAELGELWPFPLNFARHWLSTALREQGIDDATICSFLGHVLLGTQNLSPLALQTADVHYAVMRPKLDAVLRAAGLRAFAPKSTVTADVEPARQPGPVDEVKPLFEFGSVRRARERAVAQEALEHELQAFLKARVPDGNLKGLNRKQVDEMFVALTELTPIATSYRAYRLRVALRDHLSAVARRYQKDWVLPSVEVGLADFQIAIDADAFAAARQVQELRRALAASLSGTGKLCRTASSSEASEAPVGVLALAVAAECLVLDYPVLRSWVNEPSRSFAAIRGALGVRHDMELWIRIPVDGVGTRLHPIPPWLVQAAVARMEAGWVRNDPMSVDRDIARFARDKALHWLDGGLKGVVRTVRAAASLSLTGMSLSYADGTHGSVSLPRSTMDRLVFGAVRPETLESMKEATRTPPESLDVEAIADDQTIAHSNVCRELRGVRAFLEMIGDCFEMAASFTTAKAEKMASGRTRVEFFGAVVKEKFNALQGGTALPAICGHLAGWLCAMCGKGARLKGKKSGMYSFRSVQTYWSNVARRLIEQVDVEDLEQMNAVDVEEIYRDLLEFADTDRLDHIYTALRVFHAYMMRRFGIPSLEWSALFAMANSGPGRVDANLVLESEYRDALRLLKSDPAIDPRQRLMQAAVLVLCYRCGLRIGEAIGLRRKDITCIAGVWIIRVSRNLYRGLKSDTSVRIVPILEVLDPLESECLDAWVAHADEYLDGRVTTALFTKAKGDRTLVPRSRVAARIRVALHRVTGDPTVRLHHCRHGLPNRLIAVSTSARTLGNAHLEPLMNEWPQAAELLGVLTQQDVPTRRLIWAVANLMGHTPKTLLRSYWHLGGELLGAEARKRWWAVQEKHDQVLDPVPESVDILQVTPRTSVALDWPAEIAPAQPLTAELVDRTIDMLRRHGRADGVADALLISEPQVQEVATAAFRLVQECRGELSQDRQWWFAGKDVVYSRMQVAQAHRSITQLARDMNDDAHVGLQRLAEYLDERQNMVIVATPSQFKRYATLLKLLVADAANVEMVLPTQTVKRQSPAERVDAMRNGTAPKRGRPGRDALEQPLAIGDDVWASWIGLAESMGISQARRSHLLSSRGGGKNRKARQVRVGLRIRQNSNDRVHDAKTALRVLTGAAVWKLLMSAREGDGDAETTSSKPSADSAGC